MDITYGELTKAMNSLGFKKRIVKSDDILKEEMLGRPRYFIEYYKDEDAKPFFAIFQKHDNSLVAKHSLVALFYELEAFGHIRNFDDLAKMIEQNRLAGQKAQA